MKTNNFFKRSAFVLAILISAANLQAQTLLELNSYIDQLRSSSDAASIVTANHLNSLLLGSQPTVNISSSITTSGDTPPLCANVKTSGVAKLSTPNALFTSVELITIRLRNPSDLNFLLDLPRLSGFPAAKHILFLCEFECNPASLQSLFVPKNGIVVLYKISLVS
jgi:hypothetical protein